MSLTEEWVYRKLNELYRDNRGFIRTLLIAELVGKNERIIRKKLVDLENKGYVKRKGQRGGWMPARAALALAL